jgi:hypothetical protein
VPYRLHRHGHGRVALDAPRLLVGLLATLAALAAGAAAAQIVDGSRAADLDQCVEETAFMRRYHMELLLHKRDLTMRAGIRTPKHSLMECVACHAGRDADGKFVPINARGQFCAECHTSAAVDMDCFQCHAATPDPDARGGGHALAAGLSPAPDDSHSPGTD